VLRNTAANIAASVFFVAVAGAVVIFVVLNNGSGAPKRHAAAPTSDSSVPRSTTTIAGAPPVSLTDTGLASLTSTTDTSAVPTPAATDTVSPSGTTASTTPVVLSELTARRTVVAYLNDVNFGNRTAAQQLICQALLPSWLQNVNTANSDFNYVVTNARFTGSEATTDHTGLVLHYTLTFSDSTSNAVDFTVIQQSGPKICGETRG
jgi:hypothetical protein